METSSFLASSLAAGLSCCSQLLASVLAFLLQEKYHLL